MRTTATVLIPAAGDTGLITLGPFDKGMVLQGYSLFGQKLPAAVTVRVGVCDRPALTPAELSSGDLITYPFVVSATDAFWQLGLSHNMRMLSKRFLTCEFVFGSALAADWYGGINVAALPAILHRWSLGDRPGGLGGVGGGRPMISAHNSM